MERRKASDFPQELLNLFDGYVHGRMNRREFLAGAQQFAVGGVTAAALFEMLRPNYAWAVQIPADDKRIEAELHTVPSPEGNGSIKGYLVRPVGAAKLPVVLVVHENRGLNPYIEDVARRLAVANFIAFAPDGLTSVGGYPGDDEKGATLFNQVDRAKMAEDFFAAAMWLKSRPDSTGKLGVVGFCFGGGIVNQLAVRMGPDLAAAVPFTVPSPVPPRRRGSRRRSMPNTPNWTHVSPADGQRSMPYSRRRRCRTRVISITPQITAFTTTQRLATTKPRPRKRGSIRWTGSTNT